MDVDLHAAGKPDIAEIDRAGLPHRATSASLDAAPYSFEAVMPYAIWEQMQRHAHTRLDVEVGGVLVGKVVESDEGKPYLIIDGGIPALAADSRETNITFTAEAWTSIHEAIDRDHPGAIIVGWYHTHPSFGIFLSEMDVFIQRHFFDLPHQVAIVIDPVAKTHGCFFWRDGVPTVGLLHLEGEPQVSVVAATPTPSPVPAPVQEVRSATREAAEPRDFRSRRSLRRIIRAKLAAISDPFTRLEWSQWAALVTLLALAGVLFGALSMLLLDVKPADVFAHFPKWLGGGSGR